MLFNLLLLIVLLATVAMLFREGMWSNAVGLINTVTAGVLATNYFEPATRYLSETVPYMDYNWDVLVLGILFAAAYFVLRTVTIAASRHRVRFHPLADQIGSIVLAGWIGWGAVCFVTFALHTSPLARNFLSEGFQPEKRMFFGLAPDRQWLGFVHKLSNGGSWGANQTDEEGNVTSAFDPRGEFMPKYASRRSYLEKHESAFAGTGE
jgi:hypothetical protein